MINQNPKSPLALLADPTLLKTDALIDGEWIATAERWAPTMLKQPSRPPIAPGAPGAASPPRSAPPC